ncbi:MAG: hypothetical protein ACREJ4_05410 [Candidatus Methylomirabilaceae bacterium]
MPIVKLVFDIDDQLRNRFKAKVAIEGATIKDVLTRMVEQYLTEPKTAGPKGKATGRPARTGRPV